MTRHLLLLAGIILPLGLDTFALAAALGVAGIPANRRGPTSLILAAFEAGMPIVGFLIGGAVGHAIGDLGLAISVDELAVGFSLGLLGLPLVVAVIWLGVQAFLAAQIGMRVGSRLGDELRERGEQLAGVVLIGMAVLLLVLKLLHGTI